MLFKIYGQTVCDISLSVLPLLSTHIYTLVIRDMKLTVDTDEDARTMAAKYLTKYRPQFIENATKRESNDSPQPAPGGDAIAA
jgi:hypothetical protein